MLENGINILSTYSQDVLPLGWFMGTFAAILFMMCFLILLIEEIYVQYKYPKGVREYKGMILFLIGVIAFLLTAIICGNFIAKKTYTITRYKVTISDEVSFNEVSEKYDIIDQEGLIYTITEKEKE